jgi:hypothetical protein
MKVYVSIQSRSGEHDYNIFGVYSTVDKAIAEAKKWLTNILDPGMRPIEINQYNDGANVYQDGFNFDIEEREVE